MYSSNAETLGPAGDRPMQPPAQGTEQAMQRFAEEQAMRNHRYGPGIQGNPPAESYTPPEDVSSRSYPGQGPEDVAQAHNP